MRKLGALALVSLVVVAVPVGLVGVSSAVAAEEQPPAKPASIEAYERLVVGREWRSVQWPEASAFKPFPEDAKDIIAGYDRLFNHMEAAFGAPGMHDVENLLGEGPNEWNDAEKAKVTRFLDANQDLIREIRLMADRGGPVYPLNFSKGLEMELLHLAKMRSCARVIHASAVMNATSGDYNEAVGDIIAGMKLGAALAQEPVLVSQLVRIAIYHIMRFAVQNSFDGSDLSPELTRRLFAHLEQADHRGEFAESYGGELYLFRRVFSAIRAGDRRGLPGDFDLGPPQEADEKAYVEIMQRFISAARLPYYEAARDLDQIDTDIQNLPQALAYTRAFLPALSRSCAAQARHEAFIDLIQIGILVEQYKVREGYYPDTLDDIASGLGGSLPVDPFSGEKYRYRPLGSVFVLYSISHNRLDDGGTHDYMKGDIVWRGEQNK
jgi:hypothetical protein